MIRIDQELTLEGVTIYRDESKKNTFYVLPNQPRFRLDDTNKPVFKFIKYRNPLDRADGKKGGGFVIFDSEFVVPEDKMKKVISALEDLLAKERIDGPVQIGEMSYTRGTATLQLLDSGSGALVQKLTSAGKPSLFGHNVCSFTAELSPEGAAVLEAALQGSGGVAQVIYDLYFMVKIPPIGGHVWFRAEKFYSYWQQIDKSEDHWWNGNSGEYKDTRREHFRSSDSGGVDFNFDWTLPDPELDAKLKNKLRDWGWGALEDAVKRLVLTDPVANTETGLPEGVHHVTRDFSNDKTASFDRYFRESDAVEWHMVPQGTLPNITGLGFKWADFAVTVDADDPFFQTLNVNAGVNADFKLYGIDSVDVHVEYQSGKTHAVTNPDFHFTSPDQRSTFRSYIENGLWKYTYSYQVNYHGESRVYKSGPIPTDQTALTINVGDLGLLSVKVIAGNIDFKQVANAEVCLEYDDPSLGMGKLEQRYLLVSPDSSFHWLKVLLAPRTKPVSYSVKYTMKESGQEYTVSGLSANSPEIFIDDPFYTKPVYIRALGDFVKDIDLVFLDLCWVQLENDPKNKYEVKQTITLSKGEAYKNCTFPALTGAPGKLTYSGKIKFQDTTDEDIPQQTASSDTIYLASTASFLEVQVNTDLLDWSQVKLVTGNLQYKDDANRVDESKPFSVKGASPVTWHVKMKDKTKKTFTWSANFFLPDPADPNRTIKREAKGETADPIVILEVPPA